MKPCIILSSALLCALSPISATAAALALEECTSVEQVPYEKLKIHLERYGQILAIPASSRPSN